MSSTKKSHFHIHIFTFWGGMFTENHIFIYIFINIYKYKSILSFFVNCNDYKK